MNFVEEIDSGMWKDDGSIYVCNCGSEALAIEFTDDEDFIEDDFCSMSMWYYGHAYYTFFEKLRMCWYIFKRGHPYTDNICFSKKQAELIKSALEKKLKETKDGKSVEKNDES